MKRKKSFLVLLLVCIISICATFFIAGCGDESETDADSSTSSTVISEEQAISIAKESKKVKDEIASYLGFRSYNISYGSISAYSINTSRFVKIKGSIMGYVDDYNSKFASKNFEATVHVVGTTGEIYSVKTKQVV